MLTAALVGCGGGGDAGTEVVYDGSYVPCKGVTMKDAQGTEVSPQPDHPDCR